MTKIAILGWSGFVWANITRKMVDQGCSVDIYSRQPIIQNPYTQYVNSYFFDYVIEKDRNLYEKQYDHIIYCIGNVTYKQSINSISAFQYMANRLQTNHIVYISSSSVYMGRFWVLTEKDTWSQHNMNIYASNKLSEEEILQTNKNYTTTIIRPRAIYGPWDRVLLYQLLTKNIFWHMLYIWSKKDSRTSMTHVATLCDFISYIIENISTQWNIYNISDKEAYNLYDIFMKISTWFFWKQLYCIPFSLIEWLSKTWIIGQNIYKWYCDIFWWSKVLDITQAKHTWFISSKDFYEELPIIINQRKRTIWSIQNMKYHRNNLPWMM